MVPAVTLWALVPGSGPRSPDGRDRLIESSSRTSTSSSTSDDDSARGSGPGPGTTARSTPIHRRSHRPTPSSAAWRRAARLVHPFPSILDGLVVGLVALVGGGQPGTAAVLGLSMMLLQFAIGTLNDIVDAPRDAGRNPPKPIAAGHVGVRAAKGVAVLSAVGGLVLASVGGPALVLLAVVVLAIGGWYDLRAKGTTLSWLPLALGIPLLPVYGWYGATGGLPGIFLVHHPRRRQRGGGPRGGKRDRGHGTRRGRGHLVNCPCPGARRAGTLVIVLHLVVIVLALAAAVALGAPTGWVAAVMAAAAVPLGGAVLGRVAALRAGTALRELAWEIQAVGTGLRPSHGWVPWSASGGTPVGG